MTSPVEILFVYNNEAHVRILREAFAAPDSVEHHLSVASTGAEALDMLFKKPPYEAAPRPDLILMDLDLPVVSGFDLLSTVRATPELRAVPVVILTREPRAEDVDECYVRGANGVVLRPVRLRELVETMRRVLDYWGRVSALPRREGRSGVSGGHA
jgi:CheY-like chemotaxis protein